MESVAIDIAEIKSAIEADSCLTLLKEALITGDWSHEKLRTEGKLYIPFQKELTLIEGYIIRGNRLLIPSSLRT